MVIRGRIRGNGRQLAGYLLGKAENEDIRILDVAGRDDANDVLLHRSMLSMSLTSELTKSDRGLYHAQINPAYGEDAKMKPEDWLQAADVLGKELGLNEQRRIVVLHTKKGRTHAHVVWERYDHDKAIMISDSFSRLAQDRARQEMERLFEHQRTPKRNEQRPEMKRLLSDLWSRAKDGSEFIAEAERHGYIIAAGVQRRPFMVVDNTGRSFDLVRQLNGIKTKEVRERMKGQKLLAEKEAIIVARKKQQPTKQQPVKAETTKPEAAEKSAANDNDDAQAKTETIRTEDIRLRENAKQAEKNQAIAAKFAIGRNDIVKEQPKNVDAKIQEIKSEFQPAKEDITKPAEKPQEEKNRSAAQNFAMNRNDALSKEEEKEAKRQRILAQIRQAQERQRNKDKDREPDQ